LLLLRRENKRREKEIMEELMAKYLANELDEKERTDFELQLIQNEEFSLDFEAYMTALALSDNVQTPAFDADKAWQRVNKKVTTDKISETNREAEVVELHTGSSSKSNFSFLKIAATLLVLAIGGYLVVNGVNGFLTDDNLMEHISADAGMDEFELPDGTLVKLNASSRLVYQKGFGIDHRNVTLIGEADFDVTRNEDLPFIIEAGQSQVEVLGTSFDIAAYPGREVKLIVTEGTVSFSSRTNEAVKEVLTQGQQAIIDAEGLAIAVSDVANDNFKSWWTREFEFENSPLSEIFERLEKTYWVEIEYPEAIKDCKWTHYNDESLTIENVLELLQGSYKSIAYEIKENQIKLEGTACDN
jgi:ferric-dicitrate binding protein FerR (iron transport regulator)